MGSDFGYLKVHSGGQPSTVTHDALLKTLNAYFVSEGMTASDEAQANRSVVVGPPDLWIHVGFSADSAEREDPSASERLTKFLSESFLIATVGVSDSTAIQMSLYRGGDIIDKFSNGDTWGGFSTPEMAAEFRGDPELWTRLAGVPDMGHYLRSVWNPDKDVDDILDETSDILGWDTRLSEVGYSHNDDGIFCKYTDYLATRVDLSLFTELHFAQSK